jgi:DNA-binding transcriptional regulator/RsmH inhibitor MraZ
MKSFQGSTISKLDNSGRLKLPPNVVMDFKSVDTTGNVILKYLPEGAVAILPANRFKPTPSPTPLGEDYFENARLRINLRKESLLGNTDTISQQGRLTLPASLLKRLGVVPGEDVALVGIGIGYEIWKPETLEAEMDKELEQARRQYEQARDQVPVQNEQLTTT